MQSSPQRVRAQLALKHLDYLFNSCPDNISESEKRQALLAADLIGEIGQKLVAPSSDFGAVSYPLKGLIPPIRRVLKASGKDSERISVSARQDLSNQLIQGGETVRQIVMDYQNLRNEISNPRTRFIRDVARELLEAFSTNPEMLARSGLRQFQQLGFVAAR